MIGGWIARATTDQSRGIACTSNNFAYIDGGGTGSFRMQTIFHELEHILLNSAAHADDRDNLMHASTAGTLLTASQCMSIRNKAATF